MKIHTFPGIGLERYNKIFQRVTQKYLKHLNHRSLMAGKLYDLTVFICRSEDNIPTHGTTELNFINNHVVNRMIIHINPTDSDKQVAAVMAHELAHVLFGYTNNYFAYGTESKSGCESTGSSFRRYDLTTDEDFGLGLKEGAVEVMARYILSHCCFSDEEGTYAREKAPDSYYTMLSTLTDSLANCFGESVYGWKYIDGVIIDKYIVTQEHPLYEEMEDVYDDDLWETNRHFYHKSIFNPFWYHAVTNTFHCIIDEYDECMGAGAFQKLCKDFDGLYNQYYEHNADSMAYSIALEYKRKAEEKIQLFEKKYAETPQEHPTGIYTKYEQYVEEQNNANKRTL